MKLTSLEGTGGFMSITKLGVVLALCLCLAACKGAPLKMIGTEIRPDETRIRPVEASATGFMLFQFIRLGQNSRFERAYADALLQAPGATRIADIVIQEYWYWAYIMNIYNFRLRGTAVRSE